MTTTQVIALLMTPLGGLIVGAAAYWLAIREDRPKARHPAE